MPKDALATTLQDLRSLLTGMEQNEALAAPHLRELRGQLAAMLEAIKALADEQVSLEGRRRAVTQQLRITRRKAQDLTVAIRAAIRSQLGHRYEGLVRYNIRPIRRRSRSIPEETGVSVYPRPDLLAAAGMVRREPEPEAASSAAISVENGAPPEEV
jgi:hypothetical protein